MNLDRDLRDALQPLAGDPVADAARVLAALPGPVGPGPGDPGPGGGKGLPPMAWWLLGAAFVAGLLGGWLAAGLGGKAPAKDAAPPAKDERQDTPPERPAKDKPDQPGQWPDPTRDRRMGQPTESENQFQIAAFGILHLEEPVGGAQDLKPGAYYAAVGSRLTVKEGVAGLLLLGSDVGMRLDTGAEVTIDADGTALDRGRIWVHSGARHADFRIDAGIAQVQTGGGICMVVREPRGCAVIALDGPIQARARTGQSVRLQSGQQVWFDPDQGPSQLQKVPFLGTATSWMTQLILLQQDDTELRERILAMVGAYEDGDFRDAAAVEIRKLGARCVPMLVRAVQERTDDREFGRRTAALVGDLLDYGYARHVLPLLKAADPEIRVLVFRALQRSTGTAERDEAFWRDADEPSRAAAIQAWYERL